MTRVLRISLCAVPILALVAGCSTEPQVVTTVVVTPSNVDTLIASGRTVTFTASGLSADGHVLATTFTWASSDAGVATIDAAGLLTTVANGTTTVTATAANGVSGTTNFKSATIAPVLTTSFAFSIPLRVMTVTWDGTSYYLSNGGNAGTGQIQQVNTSGTVTQTTPVNLDMRGVFYRPADGKFYAKSLGLDWYEVDPATGALTPLHTGIFSQSQAKPVMTSDGATILEHVDGTVTQLAFSSGAVTGTLTGFQFGVFPSNYVITSDGSHLFTMDELGTVYVYDMLGGPITTFTFPVAVVAQSAWSLSFANGLLWISDTGTGTGTLYGYTLQQQ